MSILQRLFSWEEETQGHPTFVEPGPNKPVSPAESRLCECGHTYYWHGDRAVALCGAEDRSLLAPEAPAFVLGRQCTCKGFTEVVMA